MSLDLVMHDEMGNLTAMELAPNVTFPEIIEGCFDDLQQEEVCPMDLVEWAIRKNLLIIKPNHEE